MSAAVCTNCGCDLEPFRPITIGALTIANPVTICWNGEKVPLTTHQRLIVLAIARAGGDVMPRYAVAEAAGSDEAKSSDNIIAVQLTRIKRAFRAIDPGFDAIENVRGAGLRWREEIPCSNV